MGPPRGAGPAHCATRGRPAQCGDGRQERRHTSEPEEPERSDPPAPPPPLPSCFGQSWRGLAPLSCTGRVTGAPWLEDAWLPVSAHATPIAYANAHAARMSATTTAV